MQLVADLDAQQQIVRLTAVMLLHVRNQKLMLTAVNSSSGFDRQPAITAP